MSRAAAPAPPIVNAMSVDVEDYFQVSAFDAAVSRDSWDSRESRVCANTDRLLALFDGSGRARHVLRRSAGWRTDFRDLSGGSRQAGHEIASHGYAPPAGLRPDAGRSSAKTSAAPKTSSKTSAARRFTAIARRAIRSPSARSWALDVLIEEGYRYDASIFPIHHDRYGIPDRRGTHTVSSAVPVRSSKRRDRPSAWRASICRSPAAAISGCCRTGGRAGASIG